MTVRELASVDGVIAPTAETTVPLRDDGLYRGDGVFEVIRLYEGRPLALTEHLDRLERSAATIDLDAQRAALEPEIAALLDAHGDADAQLRLIVTRGGRRIAAIEQLADWGETVSLATVVYAPTMILNGVKSLSYGANMHATRIAKANGADEALLIKPDRIVLEAPTSTIFWADAGGQLHTPALDVGILDSITRRAVVEELHVLEGAYTLDSLLEATEAFLASTTREIQPVSAIDGQAFETGPRTADAHEAFKRVSERQLAEAAAR